MKTMNPVYATSVTALLLAVACGGRTADDSSTEGSIGSGSDEEATASEDGSSEAMEEASDSAPGEQGGESTEQSSASGEPGNTSAAQPADDDAANDAAEPASTGVAPSSSAGVEPLPDNPGSPAQPSSEEPPPDGVAVDLPTGESGSSGQVIGMPVGAEPDPGPPAPTPALPALPVEEGDADAGAAEICVPSECDDIDRACGEHSDGCGGVIECGPCPESQCDGQSASSLGVASSSRGMGFTGTDDDYSSLYYVVCETVDDCAAACAEVGGSEAMCAASECTDSFEGGKDCLPATAWRSVSGASEESGSTTSAAELTVVYQEYEDFLAVEGFNLSVPEDATVLGIEVEFLRAAGSVDRIEDSAIMLLDGGERVGEGRAVEGPWGTELDWVKYGSPTDLWGRSWTAEQINAADFGAAVSVGYLSTAGNARAYVDHARITVYYCGAQE